MHRYNCRASSLLYGPSDPQNYTPNCSALLIDTFINSIIIIVVLFRWSIYTLM